MRVAFVLACFALLLAGPALAERRTFVIANNADGYGVDRCLATGAGCGLTIATAYCHAREFDHAVSFRKLDRAEITGSVSRAAPACHGACDEFIAIVCGR